MAARRMPKGASFWKKEKVSIFPIGPKGCFSVLICMTKRQEAAQTSAWKHGANKGLYFIAF